MKTKTAPIPVGTKRIVTKFLWLPKSIIGSWRWLCTASWEEEYMTFGYYPGDPSWPSSTMAYTNEWIATKWVK